MTYIAKHDNRDEFRGFFARKCEKLCKLYSLGQIHNEGDTLHNPIGSVTAEFKWDNPDEPSETHIFEMKENSYCGELCRSEYKCKEKANCTKEECPLLKGSDGNHKMECMDDKVLIKTKCTKKVTLREWLGVKEDK